MKLRVHRIIQQTMAEGFGRRYCVWVQGCSIRCPGCANQDTWSFQKGKLIEVESIISEIMRNKEYIEGVTFLGGEPFEQAEALFSIAKAIKNEGLSVITFTGYQYKELIKKNDIYVDGLLKETDLLIDGKFEIDKIDFERPWVGSANQNFIFLTDRYNQKHLLQAENKLEIHIDMNGRIQISGMADFKHIEYFLKEDW